MSDTNCDADSNSQKNIDRDANKVDIRNNNRVVSGVHIDAGNVSADLMSSSKNTDGEIMGNGVNADEKEKYV